MMVALVDNGSLEPAAHRNLRALAKTLSEQAGVPVHAVSWKHSNRLQPAVLDNRPAWTIEPWIRAQFDRGEREFVFVPFFISAEGAIGSSLRSDLERLRIELGGFTIDFADGLASSGALAPIVADRIRAVIAAQNLETPAVIVVDHGGPSAASGALRNEVAARVQAMLGDAIGPLVAASLEGAGYTHSQPLFEDQIARPGFEHGDVIVAPLFLAPGRHAGNGGDLTQIARAAEDRLAAPGLHCHFIGSIGTHPLVAETLAASLRATLSTFPAPLPA
jgi:sirohydrochlorin ferrochelatase